MAPDPEFAGWQEVALSELHRRCQESIEHYQHSRDTAINSDSCAEIVRRAAQHDAAALDLLIEISYPLVANQCRRSQVAADDLEDLVQQVMIRVQTKFRNPTSPYQPGSFPAYRNWLKVTTKSVIINHVKGLRHEDSLDVHPDKAPAREGPEAEVEARFRLRRYLELLTDPLEREAFFRRFVLGQTSQETALAMQQQHPTLTLEAVFRLVERAIRRLGQDPEVRGMLESD